MMLNILTVAKSIIIIIMVGAIVFFSRQIEIKNLRAKLQQAQSMQQLCNGAVQKMIDDAKQKEVAAKKSLEEAAKKATVHKKRADEILATPPAIATNDCESAIIRARSWIASNSS